MSEKCVRCMGAHLFQSLGRGADRVVAEVAILLVHGHSSGGGNENGLSGCGHVARWGCCVCVK